MSDETVLQDIPLPLFKITRFQNGSATPRVRLMPIADSYIKYSSLVIRIQLGFAKDGRDECGERLPEDLNKSDEEIEATQVHVYRTYTPEWTHTLEEPVFDLTSFRTTNPTQMFPTWYERMLDELCGYVNGVLLGSRWRLESVQTDVPEYLGGICVNSPVELSSVERGFLLHRRVQSEIWPQPVTIAINGRE